MPTDAEVLERYPQLAGFLNHPELGPILRQAADEGWDTQRLQGGVYDTNWYQTNWANARQLELLKSTDPAQWAIQQEQAAYSVASLLDRLGITYTKGTLLKDLTTEWMRRGQDDWYLYSELSRRVRKDPSLVTNDGAIAAKRAEYAELASNYLLKYDDSALTALAMRNWAQREDAEAIELQFREQAKQRYAHLANEIDRGLTVRQILQPMTNVVAQTLEMSPDQIDLNEGRWQSIVNFKDGDDIRTMTIGEAERWARQQKEFQFTQTARDEAFSMAQGLLEELGAIR